MTKITAKDLSKVFAEIAKNPTLKQTYRNIQTVSMWKMLSSEGIYSMTHEQIDNAKDGFIGHFNGVDCYITPLFK